MIDRMQDIIKFSLMCEVTASWDATGDRHIVSAAEPYGIEFVYRGFRPFEVEMHIVGLTNTWLFSRDIIFDGVNPDGHGGIADVQMYNDGEEFCYMRLDSPEGWCVLKFRIGQMRGFAEKMKALVPRGVEQTDMDLVIAQILMKGTR